MRTSHKIMLIAFAVVLLAAAAFAFARTTGLDEPRPANPSVGVTR